MFNNSVVWEWRPFVISWRGFAFGQLAVHRDRQPSLHTGGIKPNDPLFHILAILMSYHKAVLLWSLTPSYVSCYPAVLGTALDKDEFDFLG